MEVFIYAEYFRYENIFEGINGSLCIVFYMITWGN